MNVKNKNQIFNAGVSIIIISYNGAYHLDRLFSSFFKNNTHHPIEIILMDHASSDGTDIVVEKYASDAFIVHVKCAQNYSYSISNNYAAQQAVYPNLLFLNNDIIYTEDALPRAVKELTNPTIGAVGIRLADIIEVPQDIGQGVQHSGVTFEWDPEKEFYRPVQIRHETLAEAKTLSSGFYPAVTGAFMLCRKADFLALNGFCEEYEYGFEDIDFCLRLQTELGNKCFCINDLSLQHAEGATRKKTDPEAKEKRKAHNDTVFKRRMGEVAKIIMQEGLDSIVKSSQTAYPSAAVKPGANLRILFVLPVSLDSNDGYQVERLIAGLQPLGVECQVAVPKEKDIENGSGQKPYKVLDYHALKQNVYSFSNGTGPDLIHAWTPREKVRKVVDSIRSEYPCPVVIHLEDNEEHLLEKTVGRDFVDLMNMSLEHLDPIVPQNRYHPLRGKEWLGNVQGLTMVIKTLEKFNYSGLPSTTILPPPDESLFYPRPVNYELRRKLNIPDDHIVLVYTGNVHIANREEVSELYKAVKLLNENGRPTVLLRTGKDARSQQLEEVAGVEKYLKQLSWVSRKEVPDIMAVADIFVQPGKPGPFNDYRVPCKLLEFFALGRPVILPRANLGLLVKHKKEAYVLEEVDCTTIAEAVLKINADEQMKKILSQNSIDFYLNQISDIHLCERLYNHYLSITNQASMIKQPAVSGFSQTGPAAFSIFPPHWEKVAQSLQGCLKDDLTIVPFFEQAIESKQLPVKKDWIGFVHNVPVKVPPRLEKLELYDSLSKSSFFSSSYWKKSSKYCRGLFAFSSEHSDRLNSQARVPVHSFRIPIPELKKKWSQEAYRANPNKKIIQIGWWLQRLHAIHVLPVVNFEKIWITNSESLLENILITEYKYLRQNFILYDFMLDSIKIIFDPDPKSYEKLVTENIVFAHHYDANSLNLVLECIARHTPILVNPFKAFREYLGDDYPLYYYFYQDAADKAENEELIKKAHEHLKGLSEKLSGKTEELAAMIREKVGVVSA